MDKQDFETGSCGCNCEEENKRILDLLSLLSDNTVILKEELERHKDHNVDTTNRLIVLADKALDNIKSLNETKINQNNMLIIHGDRIRSLCNQITFLGIIVAVETAYMLYKFL
jgi:hypothetical protein